jgi:hypothetical protein
MPTLPYPTDVLRATYRSARAPRTANPALAGAPKDIMGVGADEFAADVESDRHMDAEHDAREPP